LAGLVAGAACAQLIRSQLFGVQPFGFTIFAAVGLLVLIVSVLACTFPVWRAMRVDPVVALRYE
jgi:putative ABC transport system permease protein